MIDLNALTLGQFVGFTDHMGEHRGIFQGISPDRLAIVRMWSPKLSRFQTRNSYLDPERLRVVEHTLDATVEPASLPVPNNKEQTP